MEKVPYMLILGDKEMESKTVAVRKRGQGDIGSQSVEQFLTAICEEISKKTI